MPIIKVKNLSKSFVTNRVSHKVLNNINFEVKRGDIFGIIGRSGAGKSTLLKMLNLLERPDNGSVVIDGVDITAFKRSELREIRQQIGVIFQNFNLLTAKTVFENVALPLKLQGKLTTHEINDKVNQLLTLVGLLEFANYYPRSLSGGQKQRVGIARALSTNPKILLCDEATSALDSQTTNSILELLLKVNEMFGVTIVLITHQIEVVRKICDKVVVIDAGNIVEQGNAVDLILHPKREITRKLILKEETDKYLAQVLDFYQFHKSERSQLVMLSFIGEATFDPILSTLSLNSGVVFSILHGELGRIKRMPFGQLLVEITGELSQLKAAFTMLNNANIHYEIIE